MGNKEIMRMACVNGEETQIEDVIERERESGRERERERTQRGMGKEEGIKIEEGRGGNIYTPKRESRPETIFLDFWSIPIVFSLPCHAKSKVAFREKNAALLLHGHVRLACHSIANAKCPISSNQSRGERAGERLC